MNSPENEDARLLHETFQGKGLEQNFPIELIKIRSHKERMKIRHAYKDMYGKDLLDELGEMYAADEKKIMLALFTDPLEFDVDCIYKAIKGAGTDEDVLIEIFASRPGWYLKRIKKLYKKKYERDLEKDVEDDTSFSFKKLLISLLQCKRSTNEKPNEEECKKIAEELYKAGEKQLGTDEPVFNKAFALSSPHELIIISREYHKLTGNLLTNAIDKEFSGDIKKLLKAILYAQISPSEYFATRIHDAVDGVGTSEKTLTRILVSRAEIDLNKIKKLYEKLYSKDMIDHIEKKVSGDYKKILHEILINH